MNTELAEAYEFCRAVTRRHAKSFYFAAKLLPHKKQPAIFAVYALCRTIDDTVDEAAINTEKAAFAAIENWKKWLDEVYQKNDNKIEKRLDVTSDSRLLTLDSRLLSVAWRDLLQTYKIDKNLPLELMTGVAQDTYINRYENFADLYIYCYRVASTVGLMSSEIFGYEKQATLGYAEALGVAMQLTNVLRDIAADALMNRIYLPQEDLRRFEVPEEQIFAGKINENFVELMKFQIGRAREFYQKAEPGIALLDRGARLSVLFAARVYGRILDEIERRDYDVFSGRAHTTKRQKLFAVPRIWLDARRMDTKNFE